MARARRVAAFALYQIGRMADRVGRLSHYLAVGTLRFADMQDSIRQTWDDFYDTQPAVDSGLLAWEKPLADRLVPAGSKVLVIGCGSGRDLFAFAERGCHVTGVDPSAAALRIARQKADERGWPVTLVEGFFETLRICDAFDVIVFSYFCYSFIPESKR